MRIGYARVSTTAQNLDMQIEALNKAGCEEIYKDDILLVEFADKSGGKYLVGLNEETASWGIMDRYEYQSLKEG